MKKISEEEFNEAYRIVEMYKAQNDPYPIQVSITYKADVSVTYRVPRDWTPEKINSDLHGGPQYYSDSKVEEGADIEYLEITEMIVNGEVIDITKLPKIK